MINSTSSFNVSDIFNAPVMEVCKVRESAFKLRFLAGTTSIEIEEDVRRWNVFLRDLVIDGQGYFVLADEVGYLPRRDAEGTTIYVLYADDTFYEGFKAHLDHGAEVISAVPVEEVA